MTAPLHVAVVTETYPPEVNGVAMTLGRMVQGLLARGLVTRPEVLRQAAAAPRSVAALDWERIDELLVAALRDAIARPDIPAADQSRLGFQAD